MSFDHLLLTMLSLSGLVVSAWMLRTAGDAWRGADAADRVLVALVPVSALVFVFVGSVTIRTVLGGGALFQLP